MTTDPLSHCHKFFPVECIHHTGPVFGVYKLWSDLPEKLKQHTYDTDMRLKIEEKTKKKGWTAQTPEDLKTWKQIHHPAPGLYILLGIRRQLKNKDGSNGPVVIQSCPCVHKGEVNGEIFGCRNFDCGFFFCHDCEPDQFFCSNYCRIRTMEHRKKRKLGVSVGRTTFTRRRVDILPDIIVKLQPAPFVLNDFIRQNLEDNGVTVHDALYLERSKDIDVDTLQGLFDDCTLLIDQAHQDIGTRPHKIIIRGEEQWSSQELHEEISAAMVMEM